MQNQKDTTSETVDNSVRVRFAPSPTGGLHIGGVRTALYNYLLAKKLGGKMILRIEDTDSTRFVEGAEQYIIDSFKWLGMEFDEGPHIGGDYAPYRQSERRDIYKGYADQLINDGNAYYAFDTPEEITAVRDSIENFSYGRDTRMTLRNSLTMSTDEIVTLIDSGVNYTIRIKYPDTPILLTIDDDVRGKVVVNSATLDDKVIWKSVDQLPTYHLANIVDDHLMKISHVIRGEEWLPSAPLHVFLYQCFGWDAPKFAHLPLILKPYGHGKLSKRDGDDAGFPVFPLSWKSSLGYKEAGYTPEALINILELLGWNPGTTKEIYSMDELVQDFSIERVNKAGARFNVEKAKWFNMQHMKNTNTSDLVDTFKSDLTRRGIVRDDKFIYDVVDANKSKVTFITEMYDAVKYLFEKPTSYDPKASKKWKTDSPQLIEKLRVELSQVWNWKSKSIQKAFEGFVSDNNLKFGDIAPQLRMLLTGLANGSSMFDIMEMIGKASTIDRITVYLAVDTIGQVNKGDTSGGNTTDALKITKLQKDLEGAKKALKMNKKKLSSSSFVDKAPAIVVKKEQEKGVLLLETIATLETELATMV